MAPPHHKRSQDKKLREREDLVRRSPILDDGPKVLWIEIARGWAWNDKSCFPSQEALARALGWTTRRVRRNLAILIKENLLIVKRVVSRNNTYVLPDRIPARICDPERLINKNLTDQDLGLSSDRTRASYKDAGVRTQTSSSRGRRRPNDEDESVLSVGTQTSSEDEISEAENSQDESSEELRAASRSRPRSTKGSKKGRKTSQGSDEFTGHLVEVEGDIQKKVTIKRAPRARRAADKSFVDGAGEMHGTAPPPGVEVVSAVPRPPETPEEMLTLLGDEIRLKYGEDAYRAMETDLSKAERAKLENGILAKFKKREVVLAMIRVLVWDWEVIRSECWPENKNVRYPCLMHLLIYRAPISSAVTTGFDYSGNMRGAHDTYASRYLSGNKIVNDPF